MIREVIDIGLFPVEDNVGITLTYSPTSNSNLTKVLLERYEISLTDEDKINAIKDVIDQQSVQVYIGSNTAYMSTLFHMGGGDIFTDADIIDITAGTERLHDFIIDDISNRNNNMYVYRVLNYGNNRYESSTKYVAGLILYEPPIDNPNLPDSEYIGYLDIDELEELMPGNVDGLIAWASGRSLFHETYRLRHRGEIESFKFSSYSTRGWINLYMLSKMMNHSEDLINNLIIESSEL